MRLTLHLSAIDNMSRVVGGAARRSAASLQSLQQKTSRIATQARSSMMDAGIMAAGGVLALKYPLQMAANYEKLRLSMNIFTGNVQEGGRVFQQTIDLAARTPLGLQEISRATTMMMGYGQAADDALASTKMLGDITALTPAGDLNAAIVAYGQAAQEGKALTRDLRQFINAGVPIVDILKNTFGKDAKIMELASQGKVTFQVLKESLEAATSSGGKFNNGLKQLSETASGQWVVLVDEIGRMAAVFGDSVLPMMKDLMSWLKPVVAGFAAWVKQNQWFAKSVMIMVMAFTAAMAIGFAYNATVWMIHFSLGGLIARLQLVTWAKIRNNIATRALVVSMWWETSAIAASIKAFFAKALVITGSVIPAISAAVTSVWTWITANTALTASIFAIPIVGWILAAITAMGALSYVLYKNWAEVTEFFENLKEKFIDIIPFGRAFGENLMTAIWVGMKTIMPRIIGVVDVVKDVMNWLHSGDNSQSGQNTNTVASAFNQTKGVVSGAINDISQNTVNKIGVSGVSPISNNTGGSVALNYNPTINMGATTESSEVALLLENQKEEIYKMMKEEQRLSDRKRI